MRVGEVAARAGVNVETPAPHRDPSGHRRYDEETVRFLRAIKEAQAVGFTLAEIGEYLKASRRPGAAPETLRVRMAAKIDEIDARTRTPVVAFVAAQRLEDAPFLGDAWFYRALSTVGCGRSRLVETDEGAPLPEAPPLTDGQTFSRPRLRLTADGERVRASRADRVDLLGIDRWVGGTHVTPQNLWRWDKAAANARLGWTGRVFRRQARARHRERVPRVLAGARSRA